MKKFLNWRTLFLTIILLSAFLRLWKIDSNPPSMHFDEADGGYSAYSILNTSSDQYGNYLPMLFQNNHREPLYVYSLVPSVGILGLNPFSVRFPSAVNGIVMVVIMFFLVQKLFENRKLSLLSAFLLAINPWSIQISRTGLEESLSLLLVMLGITLILYSENKKYFLPISGIILSLSLFSYHAPIIFLTIFLPILFFCKKNLIKKDKAYFILFVIVFGLSYLLAAKQTIVEGVSKFSDTSIFNSAKSASLVNYERHLTTAPLFISSIFHNKPLYYLKTFETNYVGIFSLNYLFINGESSLDKGVSNHGEFYLFELPFFFLGLYYLFKNDKKVFLILFSWMLIGAIPGGFTVTAYLTYRDILLLPTPIIFSSLGIVFFFELIFKKERNHAVTYLILFFLICIPFILSCSFTYFFDYPVYSSDWWQLPQKKALEYISINQNKYNRVYVSGGEDWSVLDAFYNKMDPRVFQKDYKNQLTITNTKVIKIGNIYFGNFPSDQKEFLKLSQSAKKILFVGFSKNLTKNKPVNLIRSPDGVNIVVYFFKN